MFDPQVLSGLRHLKEKEQVMPGSGILNKCPTVPEFHMMVYIV